MKGLASIAGAAFGFFSILSLIANAPFAGEKSGEITTIEIYVGELYFQVAGKEKNAPITLEADKEYFLHFINEGLLEHQANFGKNPEKENGLYARYAENLMPGFVALHLKPKEAAIMRIKISKSKIGKWELGCFMPGHYEGGQYAVLNIVSRKNH